jgi:putative spermidine/putrescine transport system substrate-binding protein
VIFVVFLLGGTLCAYNGNAWAENNEDVDLNKLSLQEIADRAKAQGHIESVGMPDSWANYENIWGDIEKIYGITHNDTDMGSAEELAIFEAEKRDATKDMGDIGLRFAPIARKMGVSKPYKTSYWDEIPSWAKDNDGYWAVAYMGTTSILTNDKMVPNPPKSFADILKGNYKVCVGNVVSAAQSQHAVLASAFAMGGGLDDVQPGIEFWKTLAKQKRLDPGLNRSARVENGEIACTVLDDYNALGYRDNAVKTNPAFSFSICIPQDAAVQAGYVPVINPYAPHIYAAALAREYMLSDAGQIRLAEGYAMPIRNVKLPADLEAKRIPSDQYKKAIPLSDVERWEAASKKIVELWQEEVMPLLSD